MNCPVCQEPNGDTHAEVRNFRYLECKDCDHVFLDFVPSPDHVDEVFEDGYFFGGGSGYDDYLSESRLIEERGRKYADILGSVSKPGRLLDVGCGGGFTAKAFRDRGWQVEGLEPNERMALLARSAFGIPVHVGTLEAFFPEESFDAVVAIQVAAHFSDAGAAFEKLRQLTRDGGYLLIETWNYRSWMARICGAGWHEFSPPSVLNCFSRKSLDQLARLHGFERIKSRVTLKKIRGGHARSLLESKAGDSRLMAAMALMSRAIPKSLPIYYPADDLFWALYRKTESEAT